MSAELNLQLNQVDIGLVQNSLPTNEQGYIIYMEFVTIAQQLINSIYSGQPDIQVINKYSETTSDKGITLRRGHTHTRRGYTHTI